MMNRSGTPKRLSSSPGAKRRRLRPQWPRRPPWWPPSLRPCRRCSRAACRGRTASTCSCAGGSSSRSRCPRPTSPPWRQGAPSATARPATACAATPPTSRRAPRSGTPPRRSAGAGVRYLIINAGTKIRSDLCKPIFQVFPEEVLAGRPLFPRHRRLAHRFPLHTTQLTQG